MYYQEEAEKKERRKIIAVATAAMVIILVLIVAIIVVATKKSNKTSVGGDDNAAFTIAEGTETEESESEPESKPEEETEPVVGTITTENAPAETPVVVAELPAETNTSMPSTGPEDVLPVALMAGLLVAYLSSRKLTNKA